MIIAGLFAKKKTQGVLESGSSEISLPLTGPTVRSEPPAKPKLVRSKSSRILKDQFNFIKNPEDHDESMSCSSSISSSDSLEAKHNVEVNILQPLYKALTDYIEIKNSAQYQNLLGILHNSFENKPIESYQPFLQYLEKKNLDTQIITHLLLRMSTRLKDEQKKFRDSHEALYDQLKCLLQEPIDLVGKENIHMGPWEKKEERCFQVLVDNKTKDIPHLIVGMSFYFSLETIYKTIETRWVELITKTKAEVLLHIFQLLARNMELYLSENEVEMAALNKIKSLLLMKLKGDQKLYAIFSHLSEALEFYTSYEVKNFDALMNIHPPRKQSFSHLIDTLAHLTHKELSAELIKLRTELDAFSAIFFQKITLYDLYHYEAGQENIVSSYTKDYSTLSYYFAEKVLNGLKDEPVKFLSALLQLADKLIAEDNPRKNFEAAMIIAIFLKIYSIQRLKNYFIKLSKEDKKILKKIETMFDVHKNYGNLRRTQGDSDFTSSVIYRKDMQAEVEKNPSAEQLPGYLADLGKRWFLFLTIKSRIRFDSRFFSTDMLPTLKGFIYSETFMDGKSHCIQPKSGEAKKGLTIDNQLESLLKLKNDFIIYNRLPHYLIYNGEKITSNYSSFIKNWFRNYYQNYISKIMNSLQKEQSQYITEKVEVLYLSYQHLVKTYAEIESLIVDVEFINDYFLNSGDSHNKVLKNFSYIEKTNDFNINALRTFLLGECQNWLLTSFQTFCNQAMQNFNSEIIHLMNNNTNNQKKKENIENVFLSIVEKNNKIYKEINQLIDFILDNQEKLRHETKQPFINLMDDLTTKLELRKKSYVDNLLVKKTGSEPTMNYNPVCTPDISPRKKSPRRLSSFFSQELNSTTKKITRTKSERGLQRLKENELAHKF